MPDHKIIQFNSLNFKFRISWKLAILNFFDTSQLNIKYKINKLHERALRTIHKDKTSSFKELRFLANSAKICLRKENKICNKKWKTKAKKTKKTKKRKKKKGSHYGANTVSHLGKEILELVLKLTKEVSRTNQFRENKKLCSQENCTCYIWNMHFPQAKNDMYACGYTNVLAKTFLP